MALKLKATHWPATSTTKEWHYGNIIIIIIIITIQMWHSVTFVYVYVCLSVYYFLLKASTSLHKGHEYPRSNLYIKVTGSRSRSDEKKCASVSPVWAVTFDCLDLQTSFLACKTSRSRSSIKVTESRSRSYKDTSVSKYTHLWVVCLQLKGNLDIIIPWLSISRFIANLANNMNVMMSQIFNLRKLMDVCTDYGTFWQWIL